jgi:aromatic ring-opening dioxygenase LigB subunit
MAQIVAAMASSHAYAFLDPEEWDARRRHTRGNYARRYGHEPPEQPQVAVETLADNQQRYRPVREAFDLLRARFRALEPDVLVMIGDDQDENYLEDNLPQFAVYLGKELVAVNKANGERQRYACDADLAWTIATASVEAGFDLAYSKRFPDDALFSHAHREPLAFLDPEGRVQVVPIFLNAIHVPAPTPARCYQFGQQLREIIEASPDDKRVVLYASGGLSHFTAGYPWPHYEGPHSVGSICQDFDRRIVGAMADGRGAELGALTSRDLIENGEIELRQWIVLQGALGTHRPERLVYEPFYRGMMGMAVGYWDLANGNHR